MNTQRPQSVSVIAPITPAIDRVQLLLFDPFDLGRWFIIGFCAWLALLGSGGGGSRFNYTTRENVETKDALNTAKVFILENLSWLVPLVVFLVIFSVVLWLVLTWLSSRGKFMFLHCIALNKAEVSIPWAKYREQANSLFLFRIVLALIGFAVVVVPIIFLGILVSIIARAGAPTFGLVIGMILLGFGLFIIFVSLGLVAKFTTDFTVPIMFLKTLSCRAAWSKFLTILSVNKARFVLYVLFQIIIAMVIGMICFAATCATCCCFACVAGIPYIGTVLLLPLHIFNRAYSLYYLQQFGMEYNVFALEHPELYQPEQPQSM